MYAIRNEIDRFLPSILTFDFFFSLASSYHAVVVQQLLSSLSLVFQSFFSSAHTKLAAFDVPLHLLLKQNYLAFLQNAGICFSKR